MLKILICDDRTEWLEETIKNLEKVMTLQYSLSAFDSAETLLEYLNDHKADIVITDIQMPGMDGIELATTIFNSCGHDTQIIFTSIFPDYIQDIFGARPAGFLVKPFDLKKFEAAIKIAIENLNSQKETIAVPSRNSTSFICHNEIIFVESYRRTVIFHTADNKYSCCARLDDIEKQLPKYFIRCHQSYLVNCGKIKSFSKNLIELTDGSSVPIAKARSAEIKRQINEFFGSTI